MLQGPEKPNYEFHIHIYDNALGGPKYNRLI